MNEHERTFEALAWFVNGSLDAHEQQRARQHIEQCAACRAELDLQQRVRDAITQPPKVEFAPQAAFNKLWERVEQQEEALRPPRRTRAKKFIYPPRVHLPGISQWMPVALGVQALVIVALAVALFTRSPTSIESTSIEPGAPYRTVTATVDDRPIIHAVFDDAIRLTDTKDILSRAGLEVASGPTAAGVYSLTPDGSRAQTDLNAILATLRADPRVRFAEVSHR